MYQVNGHGNLNAANNQISTDKNQRRIEANHQTVRRNQGTLTINDQSHELMEILQPTPATHMTKVREPD